MATRAASSSPPPPPPPSTSAAAANDAQATVDRLELESEMDQLRLQSHTPKRRLSLSQGLQGGVRWRKPGFGAREHQGKIVIACAGLPARGKTHCSRSLERYLTWLGINTKVFSLSDHRRQVLGSGQQLPTDYFFFEGRSPGTDALRQKVADGLEDEVVEYLLEKGGQVAIYDANNQTIKGRTQIRKRFEPLGIQTMFIENQCDRDDIIETNIRSVKLSSPDYKDWDPNKAVADYWQRIRDHERFYEPVEQPSFPYVKLINVGETVVVNNIQGYLQSKVVFFLMNIHNRRRTIWIARSGQSEIEHSYKADTDLSSVGKDYAKRLRSCILERRRQVIERRKEVDPMAADNPLNIWVSSRRRCVSTSRPIGKMGYRVVERGQMCEINPGVVDGMTMDEIKEEWPDEYARSKTNPYRHRYPRGESYHDLSVRLEPVICELERERSDLLIIAHASVIRCLLAYLQGRAPSEIPMIDAKRGDLIELSPTSYGTKTEVFTFWEPTKEQEEKEKRVGDAFHSTSPVIPPVKQSPELDQIPRHRLCH